MPLFNALLEAVLAEWEWDLHQQGCLEIHSIPEPTLTNSIIPMFRINSWATGPNQHTRRFYRHMEPAFRLASLLLTEDCMLSWFSHLTCGDRQCDHSRSPSRDFIMPTRRECGRKALSETKDNLSDLGEVITLMFHPLNYSERAYGTTYPWKERLPWFGNFRSRDWPRIDDKYYSRKYADRRLPCIVMSSEFQEFFLRGYEKASICLRYRTLLVFATTLVHEVAHAYWMWISDSPEPLWDKHEKNAELGFSWESVTLGRVLNPLFHEIRGCSMLFSVRMEEYPNPANRQRILKSIIRERDLKFVRLELTDCRNLGALLNADPKTFRGSDFFCKGTAGMSYVCVIHAIPMKWIVDWFQELEWNKKRQKWRDNRTYEPPPLGPTFFLGYQRNSEGYACIHRPLNPNVQQDSDFIEYMERTRQAGCWNYDWVDKYDEYIGYDRRSAR